MTAHELNELSYSIIESAIEVHRRLGPGLLESVYRVCLSYELRQRGMLVVAERLVPICYKSVILDGAYRLDLLIADELIVEVKSVEGLLPVHSAQLLSYLRLTNKPIGLLINFNVSVLIKGVKRVMNGRYDAALRTKQPPRFDSGLPKVFP